MKRSLTGLLALTLVASLAASPAVAGGTARHSGSPGIRTVLGLGPELHLLPNIGRVGTKVLVVGIGGFVDHQFTNKRTTTEGFIVTG